MVYTIGSAFYGMYFIVSFPAFYRLDENFTTQVKTIPHTMYQTVMEALGCSMAVLLLLDFCRLALGIPLSIGRVGYYVFDKKIKCNA
jgi:cycloeucalenol cycloisomerase